MNVVKNLFKNVGRLVNGVRVGVNYTKTSNGTTTLLASSASARNVLIAVKVTETFAAGTGAKPTFKLGETDTTDKYAAAAVFAGGVAGDVFIFAGTLTADKALLVTVVAATGTATGALSVEAIVLPSTA